MDSLKIPVELDDKKIPTGIKNISKQLAKLKGALNTAMAAGVDIGFGALFKLRDAITGIFNMLKNGLLGLMVVFALSLRKIFAEIREGIEELITKNLKGTKLAEDYEKLKGGFTELKMAIANAFLPLVQFAIPHMQTVVNFLIDIFNKAAMITAAFFGQKQALQVVAGSAAKLAKSTKDTEKAAKNTLAAFDEINVLQTEAAKAQEANPLTVETQMVPITDDILAKVQTLKDLWEKLWTDPLPLIRAAWAIFKDWIKTNVLDPIAAWWEQTWLHKNVFEPLLGWALTMWEQIKLGAQVAWLTISNLAGLAWEQIKIIWGEVEMWFYANVVAPLVTSFIAGWFELRKNAFDAWEQIKAAWLGAPAWFQATVIDPIKNGFNSALDWIGNKFTAVFTGIQNFIYNTINKILGFINDMINTVMDGINSVLKAASSISGAFNVPSVSGGIGGLIGGLLKNIPIPHLATGAVIPPNAQFAAVLGDNKRENEILAPESKFLEMAQMIADRIGGGGVIENTIMLDGDVLYKATERAKRRRGTSLISEGITR